MRDRGGMMPGGMFEGGAMGGMGGGARNVLVQTQRAYSLYVTSGQTHSIELLRYIDATTFASGSLMVRLQQKADWPDTAVVTVELQNVSPAPDDPASLYTDGTDRAKVTFSDSDSAPALKVDDFAAPIGGYFRCVLKATASEAGQVDFTIGVNVVGRDG